MFETSGLSTLSGPHASFRLTRRSALLGLAASFSMGRMAVALAAAPTDRRFVVVILRGALDGMAAVVPYGDPALMGLRAELLPPGPNASGGMLDLGGFYGLHPALGGLHGLYQANELLPVHAVAGPTRVRSHFEAQDYLEFGIDHTMTSGWLNRVAGLIPAAGGGSDTALAVGTSVPMLLRGPVQVGTWMPSGAGKPAPDFYARIAELHHADLVTGPAIREGLKERGFTETTLAKGANSAADSAAGGRRNTFPALCSATGKLLAAADGPRLAALEIGGWDTHAGQKNRLNTPLAELDAGLVALKGGLGNAWKQTVVLVVTEFGRTARVNGNGGTDHGTGSVAFVLGGSVAGGRVQADWPGLGNGNLLENRDLQPTADLRSVAKGLLAAQFHLGDAALAQVFPDSGKAPAMRGLVRG